MVVVGGLDVMLTFDVPLQLVEYQSTLLRRRYNWCSESLLKLVAALIAGGGARPWRSWSEVPNITSLIFYTL